MNSNGIVGEVASWLTLGGELKAKLITERDEIRHRLAEIEKLLAAMPDGPSQGRLSDPITKLDPATSTWPQLVRAIVDRHPNGVSPASVIRELALDIDGSGKKFEPPTVYSVLYRLLDAGKIRATGEKGARRFFPAGGETE